MEEKKALLEKTPAPIETSLKTAGGLIPHNLDQLWRLAGIMARSGMMPKGIQTPEAVAVAVQMGLEVGLSPMSAVQNIAVINGRPSIWGDSVLGLVRASGLLEDFDEQFEGEGDKLKAICTAKRKDQKTEIVRTFSVADAKLAKLWEKKSDSGYPSPWVLYPKRMLQMRARSWALRDGFGDVIKGLRVAEEVIDMVTTDGESFAAGGDPVADLNEKITLPESKTKDDLYKVEEPEKPKKTRKSTKKKVVDPDTPISEPTDEAKGDPGTETQTEKILRLVSGAKMDDNLKQPVIPCPQRQNKGIPSNWCLQSCNDRSECKLWADYDAE